MTISISTVTKPINQISTIATRLQFLGLPKLKALIAASQMLITGKIKFIKADGSLRLAKIVKIISITKTLVKFVEIKDGKEQIRSFRFDRLIV
jgi:hypothetical protein